MTAALPAPVGCTGQRNTDRETDTLRLHDLAQEYGLKFKRVGQAYLFDDYTFTARSLAQALAFAEGFDRAKNG